MTFEDFIEINRSKIKREPGETGDQDLIERAMKFAWNRAIVEVINTVATIASEDEWKHYGKVCGLCHKEIGECCC